MGLTNAFDLTKRAPRSPYAKLGGYVTLPRLIDKARATINGNSGEYHYNCPLDQRFLEYVGVGAEELKSEIATGKGDGEILKWIQANAKITRLDYEIAQWSAAAQQRTPAGVEGREYFNELQKQIAPGREDISTWFDLLDADDYVSFGGTV